MSSHKKPDSRVRFQHQIFKRQLSQARNYKRTRHYLHESADAPLMFRVIPLAVWVFLILATAAILYLVYLPNPLSIKQIQISGISSKQSLDVRALAAQYIARPRLLPQTNKRVLVSSRPS